VTSFLGYGLGMHAPGIKDFASAIQVSHHLLLSHGKAVEVLRDLGDEKTTVGITLNLAPVHPASQKDEDIKMAKICDGNTNRWFLDSIFRGAYPSDMWEYYKNKTPKVFPGDMSLISKGIDFLGINNYTRSRVKADPRSPFGFSFSKPASAKCTDMGWEVYPEGIHEILRRVQDDYNPKSIYITENGAAFPDKLDEEGKVSDPRRISYLKEYFSSAHKAIEEGVRLKGYFVWSLMDNFEWAYGYSKRFGLIYVDYPTQKRIFKESAHWYKKVIEDNGVKIKGGKYPW